jgi:hypothetical protein
LQPWSAAPHRKSAEIQEGRLGMGCVRCPHHVREGQFSSEKQTIEFKDLCGLLMKRTQDPDVIKMKPRGRGRPAQNQERLPRLPEGTATECSNYPFSEKFDYFTCHTYRDTFKTNGLRNGVQPSLDMTVVEHFTVGGLTDMELL